MPLRQHRVSKANEACNENYCTELLALCTGGWPRSAYNVEQPEMSCKHVQDLYRTPRKWWERLLGVRFVARCYQCGRRIRYFSTPHFR